MISIISKISIVIPTRDRIQDLAELLETLLRQSLMPLEVIIVDDSPGFTAESLAISYTYKFQALGCAFNYLSGNATGLTAARNIGIQHFNGDYIFFLDDDTLLERNVIKSISDFFEKNDNALGVQPLIFDAAKKTLSKNSLISNSVNKVLFLNYTRDNILTVRRSGASIFPSSLTKTIAVKRTSGCCSYKRKVFKGLEFDTSLKRWGFMEDLDFSYNVYKKYPGSLFYTIKCQSIPQNEYKSTVT